MMETGWMLSKNITQERKESDEFLTSTIQWHEKYTTTLNQFIN